MNSAETGSVGSGEGGGVDEVKSKEGIVQIRKKLEVNKVVRLRT
ncbi:MAG: hypothetical protein ABIJ43_02960 [Candidatus Beckwithbacteria bacterium]